MRFFQPAPIRLAMLHFCVSETRSKPLSFNIITELVWEVFVQNE